MSSAVFDRIRTCDNHCAFCFIYQLPKGMRRSLYLKDDDYRLSFLYGNFTTLTRFTELDAERILTERLGPLFVSIHTTDPELRADMLRNPKGATSLRWLRCCSTGASRCTARSSSAPGSTTATALEDTLAGILDRYPALASVGVVPLGVSRYSNEPDHAPAHGGRGGRVLDTVETWQGLYRRALGRRLVFAADEYYLLAGRPLPPARHYEGYPQHENGIGMARAFADVLRPTRPHGRPGRGAARLLRLGRRRAGRGLPGPAPAQRPGRAPTTRPVTVLTGTYGARVLGAAGGRPRARRRARAGGAPTTSSAATSAWPGCSRARTWPGPRRPSRRDAATCCPTPASTRGASSTG